eukprot:SAG22_NODE_601_length_8666_cov_7.089413_6_plen_167_part_00
MLVLAAHPPSQPQTLLIQEAVELEFGEKLTLDVSIPNIDNFPHKSRCIAMVDTLSISTYDNENLGFAKTATESGINVSDRALPVVCEIERTAFNEFLRSNRPFNGTACVAPGNDGLNTLTEGATAADFNDAASMATDRPANIRYDVFAVTDMIIYITADGSVSTRI